MSTELAENRDLGPLGHPHHCGVHGFCRIFITNLKFAQGLRDLHYWIEPTTLENQILLLEHIMPSLIICITGLSVSLLIFFFEMALCKTESN